MVKRPLCYCSRFETITNTSLTAERSFILKFRFTHNNAIMSRIHVDRVYSEHREADPPCSLYIHPGRYSSNCRSLCQISGPKVIADLLSRTNLGLAGNRAQYCLTIRLPSCHYTLSQLLNGDDICLSKHPSPI